MSDPLMIKVIAPVNEIDLMKALDECVVNSMNECYPRGLSDDEIARAVNWLHSKWGSKRYG